jgi:soluble lytic murein transglycosylase
MPWADAVRFGRFAEAAEGIANLPPGEQNKPEVRLAKARVLLATGKAPGALAALEKLDDELPLLRDLIAKTRAQAMFEAGPFDQAAVFFGARRDVASLVLSAEAWEKAGDATKARAAWDRVIAADKRTRAVEENARARRMQITRLKDGDPVAAADARWLAMNALDDKIFSDAASLLEKLTPPLLLTAEELLARARVLADVGRTDEAFRTLERAATRGPTPPGALDQCRVRAEIYFKARGRYPEAALAYRSCAAMGGPHAAEDLFLSARSFDRADRTGDALPAFQAVIQKHPHTPWADQAEFHVAREYALVGRWKEAATALDDYIRHWPNGKERREAERYRGLAYLVIRDDKRARKLLEELSGSAEDQLSAARWTNLAALAALRDGDKLHALSRWAEVARQKPLSYAALIARARIAENGGTPPPTIEPAESGTLDMPAVELPAPANMLHRIGFDAEAEDALREREAAVVASAPSRGTDALCAAYALLDRGKRRYQVSLQIPVQAVATAPGGKNRGAWECMFPRPYDDVVRTSARTQRLAPELVWSVMRQESAFDPEAVSPAHAVGLMQLLPETARTTATGMGSIDYDDGKLTSPATNVVLGSAYLRELLDKLGGQDALAIAAYNAGPESIQRWLARSKAGSLDVFIEMIPFVETRGYVARVLGNLARYGYLERGEAGVPSLALDLK